MTREREADANLPPPARLLNIVVGIWLLCCCRRVKDRPVKTVNWPLAAAAVLLVTLL